MLSFNSCALAKGGQGKQTEALASIMAAVSISHEGGCAGSKCGRAQGNAVKSLIFLQEKVMAKTPTHKMSHM